VTVDRDFFLSFTGADRPWAAWLLAELDAAGYSSISQLRDFVAGSNFVVEMHRAARRARRTIGVLSPKALQAPYVWQEWAQRLAGDPIGEQRALVLVRVAPCEPEGLLGPVVYVDLVGLDEGASRGLLREELAAAVRGRRPLPADQQFPGGPATVVADMQRPRFPTALPPVWNVPYRRNPAFTGREQALAELAGRLGQGAAAAITQLLQGAGGVGKTALATEYAYRHRTEFDTVWWIRAEEPATLVGDLADLAVALRLAEAGQADQQMAVQAVRRWLDGHDRWLLVLDNAQAPDMPTGLQAPLVRLVDLLPQVLHGQVLITSRDASWEHYAALAELEVFTSEEAVAFLLLRSRSGDSATAADIAELLGRLPLALEQAGAYTRETRIGLRTYLERLQRYPTRTLITGRPRDRDPADTVATTWQVSLAQVQPTPGAVDLLEVCAFLGPEEIPRQLFGTQLDPPAAALGKLAEDPFTLDEAIAALHRFGLVKAGEQTLTVHRLLQQVIRDGLHAAAASNRARTAVGLLVKAFPAEGLEDPGVWPQCEKLLAHALAAADHAEHYQVEPTVTSDLLNNAESYLYGRARYAEAQAVAERALALTEGTYDPTSHVFAARLGSLARVLGVQGDLERSRALHERVLAIQETYLGPDHHYTAISLHNLATVLRDQGDLDRARALHERALAIQETNLGPDHHETANSLSNLAIVLHRQGNLDLARSLQERALASFEARLGPDHIFTAWSLSNLAAVLHDQGDLDGGRTVQERALSIREARLGPDHTHTAWSLNSLAAVLHDQGDLDGARSLCERALAIREARLGPDHHGTADSLDSLAGVLRDQRDLDRARTVQERALSIREARLGPEHFKTAQSLDNLAGVLHDQGNLDGARSLCERALAIRETRLGPDHPATADSLSNLATVLYAQGDLDGARRLYERALHIRETRLGPDHPDTAWSRSRLEALTSELKDAE
jgi:tetratricopeptide (TPR) repeat protein